MIVSASSGATVRTVMLSGFEIGSIGTVSVTTIPAKPASFSLSRPSFESRVPPVVVMSSPMIAILPRTRPVTSVTATTSCAARVLCMIAKSASIISAKRTACLARNGDDALAGESQIAEVAREEGQARHVVDRDLEEALDLAGVQVHRQHAVGTGELKHVGDEARRDRLPRLRLAVLPCVRKPRDDRGDPLRRCELRGLDHQQELHQVLVDRLAARLHEEDVGTADRLVEPAVGLAVAEGVQLDLAELNAERLDDPLREARMRAAREDHQPLLRPALEPVTGTRLSHGCRGLQSWEGKLRSEERRVGKECR